MEESAIPVPVLYRTVNEDPQALEMIEAAHVLMDKALKMTTIADDEGAAVIAEFRARVQKHAKDLDERRLAMGEGLRAALATINAAFNVPIEVLKDEVKRVDKLLTAHLQEKQRKAQEEQRAAEAAARQQENERRLREEEARRNHEIEVAAAAAVGEAPPPPPEPEPPPPVTIAPPPSPQASGKIRGTFGSTVGLRDNWKYEITNIKKVPEAYLVDPAERVKKSVLNAMAKATKQDPGPVPGIRFFNDVGLGSRVTT